MAGGGKRNEEEVSARSLRSLRRSVQSLKTKEASAKERSKILKLKREAKALMKRTVAEAAQSAVGKKEKEGDQDDRLGIAAPQAP